MLNSNACAFPRAPAPPHRAQLVPASAFLPLSARPPGLRYKAQKAQIPPPRPRSGGRPLRFTSGAPVLAPVRPPSGGSLARLLYSAAVTPWLSDNLAVRPLQVGNPRPPRSFGRVSGRRSSLSVVHRPAPCRPRSRLPPKGGALRLFAHFMVERLFVYFFFVLSSSDLKYTNAVRCAFPPIKNNKNNVPKVY